MQFFLAGIMQGSHFGAVLHNQDYRSRLKQLLADAFPGSDIYDPLADHGSSLEYDDAQGKRVFLHHNAMCRDIDVLIAFVPEASMGTAIEMWESYQNGRVVLTISPLRHNWVVRFLSHEVYADFDSFAAAVADGRVEQRIASIQAGKA